jgi:8-oxo-dGTP pyrophosphatase MutT (NUDIX family)
VIPFTPALRDQLAGNLARHTRREHTLDGRRHAAVAIVIVDSDAERDGHDPFPVEPDYFSDLPSDVSGLDGRMSGVAGGAAFLLCRRAATLSAHAGQWALPGGRCDGSEMAPVAALRELHEELGLLLDEDSVLGQLDDYVTRSGYVITPVVVWGDGDVNLVPDPAEVAHAYRIGLHELCRPDSPRFATIAESDRPVVEVPLGGDLIYAPTAAMLVQFRWVAIEGRIDERVDGFEQPVFAWK